jgi:hypothetical protein
MTSSAMKKGVHLMSAIKQHAVRAVRQSSRAINAELTQQERLALSLVWRDDDNEALKTPSQEARVEHCAELGYN